MKQVQKISTGLVGAMTAILAVTFLAVVPGYRVGAQTIARVTALAAGPATLNATDTGACSTAGACVVLNVGGYAAIGIQAFGTCGTCTVNFETTIDNVNWVATNFNPAASTTGVSTASASGLWTSATPLAIYAARVRMSARASGSFSVAMRATIPAPLPLLTHPE